MAGLVCDECHNQGQQIGGFNNRQHVVSQIGGHELKPSVRGAGSF